jgi:hypothetical protein
MKKHYKLTPEERTKHEQAVKIRRMTDEQLVQYINDLQHDAENAGKLQGVEGFFESLTRKPISGIGPATVAKLREFAIYANFIVPL